MAAPRRMRSRDPQIQVERPAGRLDDRVASPLSRGIEDRARQAPKGGDVETVGGERPRNRCLASDTGKAERSVEALSPHFELDFVQGEHAGARGDLALQSDLLGGE